MRGDEVLKAAGPLIGAAEAAAAVGATLRVRRGEATVTPEMAAVLDGVVGALGLRDAVEALDDQESFVLLGTLEGLLTQSADFVVSPGRPCWDHEDPSILIAQGHMSVVCATALRHLVVPSIGDDELSARLERPDAAFLDVGVGVAALAIAMCRMWPQLRVTGIDSWPPALALAREAVAAAGLEDRFELHEGTIETLDETDRYDLAWLPTFFIAEPALAPALERMHAALRPGGWVTLGLYARPGVPLIDALADMRTVRQGGALVTAQELVELLEGAGYSDAGVHFDPARELPVAFVAGRRAPSETAAG